LVTVRKIGVLLVVFALALASFAFATAALADPNLSNIPPHRHYVMTSTGRLVQVGPRVCDDPSLQGAFNEFHNNLHIVSTTGIGPAAPGLHNFTGAELFAGPC
jgi:hypothetical protein